LSFLANGHLRLYTEQGVCLNDPMVKRAIAKPVKRHLASCQNQSAQRARPIVCCPAKLLTTDCGADPVLICEGMKLIVSAP
jgi:hypothetical protein